MHLTKHHGLTILAVQKTDGPKAICQQYAPCCLIGKKVGCVGKHSNKCMYIPNDKQNCP